MSPLAVWQFYCSPNSTTAQHTLPPIIDAEHRTIAFSQAPLLLPTATPTALPVVATVRHRNKMASAKLAEEGAAASASACSGQAMADDRKVVASNTGEVKGDPSSLEIMQPDLGIAHPDLSLANVGTEVHASVAGLGTASTSMHTFLHKCLETCLRTCLCIGLRTQAHAPMAESDGIITSTHMHMCVHLYCMHVGPPVHPHHWTHGQLQ